MNDQKKPKIDLKARLGKKSVSSPSGPSIPPPIMGGSRPGGIPAPPFGAPQNSDPYSSMMSSAPPPAPKPQAIKVEMSEEVIHEQKKQLKKGYAIAAVTAVLGAVVGFLIGGSSETSNQQKIAARDAGDLARGEVFFHGVGGTRGMPWVAVTSKLKSHKAYLSAGRSRGARRVRISSSCAAVRPASRAWRTKRRRP